MFAPISFFVEGKPQPAGSKRAFVIKGTNRAIVTDANPKARDWKIDVQHAAKPVVETMQGNLITGAVTLYLTFLVQRPKSHYRTGKNSHLLRDDAPEYPASKPDVLKLARGVEDALTGMIWVDDAQIVNEYLKKRYSTDSNGIQGCHVEIQDCAV